MISKPKFIKTNIALFAAGAISLVVCGLFAARSGPAIEQYFGVFCAELEVLPPDIAFAAFLDAYGQPEGKPDALPVFNDLVERCQTSPGMAWVIQRGDTVYLFDDCRKYTGASCQLVYADGLYDLIWSLDRGHSLVVPA